MCIPFVIGIMKIGIVAVCRVFLQLYTVNRMREIPECVRLLLETGSRAPSADKERMAATARRNRQCQRAACSRSIQLTL